MSPKPGKLDPGQLALLEWARDNHVLRLKTPELEVEFLQTGAPEPKDQRVLTPEEKKKEEDRILFHSA